MSDYPMLISNKLHSFRNFTAAKLYNVLISNKNGCCTNRNESFIVSSVACFERFVAILPRNRPR